MPRADQKICTSGKLTLNLSPICSAFRESLTELVCYIGKRKSLRRRRNRTFERTCMPRKVAIRGTEREKKGGKKGETKRRENINELLHRKNLSAFSVPSSPLDLPSDVNGFTHLTNLFLFVPAGKRCLDRIFWGVWCVCVCVCVWGGKLKIGSPPPARPPCVLQKPPRLRFEL